MSGIAYCFTYDKALEYLYHSYSKGIKIGLDGVRAILANMYNPQSKLSVIHVAGTNGKGSTCALLQHILMAAGYKVGAFTSPHLHRYNERMTINAQPISDTDFAYWLSTVANEAENRPSFFEILTCMAFGYFAHEAVDIAIIETGIGGRLDSTNVIERPLLSVITAPGFDHQELLGDTLEEIAAEDGGIIKEGCPVAVYPTQVMPVIRGIAEAANAPLYHIGNDAEVSGVRYGLKGTEFSVSCAYFSYQSLSIQLLGEHQIYNAIHSLLCAKALGITDENILRRGLAQCRWPGRFEMIGENIVIDGAHNEDGARIFKEAIKRYFEGRKIVLVVGISRHKDVRKILSHMTEAADTVICTCARFKAMPATELAGFIEDKSVLIEEDCFAAVRLAERLAGSGGVVAVSGSLYLIGDVRSVYCDRF